MKKRVVSQELIYDDKFNDLSLEAQNLFIRMLSCADDYGIVPANKYTLKSLTNFQVENIEKYYDEIITHNLGQSFFHNENKFFCFNISSFDKIQGFLLSKRTKSEYLYLRENELYDSYPHFSRKFRAVKDISIKYEALSIEHKSKEVNIEFSQSNIINYFKLKGFTEQQGIDFFNYNQARNWQIGNNRVIKFEPIADLFISKLKPTKTSQKSNLKGFIYRCGSCEIPFQFENEQNDLKCPYCQTKIINNKEKELI